MKPLPVSVLHVKGSKPQSSIIPAKELRRYVQDNATLQDLEQEITRLQQAAEEGLSNAYQHAAQIREQARIQGQQEGEHWAEQARDQAINDSVVWLVDESNLEHTIANRLEEHIRCLAAQALAEFADGQDPAELLVRRLVRKVPEMLRDGQLQLRVHAWVLAKVQLAFQDQPRVKISADDALTPGQAVLENDLVTVMIDLDTHLSVLLERLKGTGHTSTSTS